MMAGGNVELHEMIAWLEALASVTYDIANLVDFITQIHGVNIVLAQFRGAMDEQMNALEVDYAVNHTTTQVEMKVVRKEEDLRVEVLLLRRALQGTVNRGEERTKYHTPVLRPSLFKDALTRLKCLTSAECHATNIQPCTLLPKPTSACGKG
ncbi:hypothetical protein HAX54_046164 [Datura stramonium]|uniref:Rx N-terminal domain-containing protein n=1 Tax=Datura stramonium TaxID=4076 RepID=A0ABS8WGQ2_DATST|nr:hypothetical protein [Datura stramonium]